MSWSQPESDPSLSSLRARAARIRVVARRARSTRAWTQRGPPHHLSLPLQQSHRSDVPAAASALLKSYSDPSKQVNGKTYPIVTARMSYGKLAERYAPPSRSWCGGHLQHWPQMGLLPVDEMWDALAEFGWYTADTPVPNPDLVALGAKFSAVEDFLEAKMKPRLRN
ncbi:hypothetical protein C8R45DRAFT_1182965 [Mycena sanguinolenta]|nr:hypothetical protein C8R45DRAFT_1182965 [Mycena sanguinolenta]